MTNNKPRPEGGPGGDRKAPRNPRRVVVYAGTRNLYHQMTVAVKSLLAVTRVDRVVLLTEDDTFPEWLPGMCSTMNVRRQTWFPPDGPNYRSHWTWMSLMRLVIPLLLPDEDRALYLDVDTMAVQDAGPLLDLDLHGNLMAGVLEPLKCYGTTRYFNAGVLLMDLEALRESGTVEEMVKAANYRRWGFPDQDVINHVCSRRMGAVDTCWNSMGFNPADDPKIIHFAADRGYISRPEYLAAEQAEWRGYACP